MGNTTINNGGVTIQPSAGDATKSVSLTNKGLDNGGNKITNVAAGEISDTSTDAVNGSQLNTVKTLAGKHTEVTVEGGTAAGTTDYAGENLKLKVTDDNGQKTYDLKLSDKLSIGGKDGQDGHIGVNGADGKSGVGIDGKDGISIKGKDGNDGVTIKGIDGKDGVNGAEGHIGLNGKDGMTDIWTKPGTPGLNGKDGETMTRIVYKDPNGQEHEAATLDDGLKFGGDFGKASAVKLDKQVDVKGNAKKETDLTDGNIGVVSSQDGDNGQLLVKLNKDLNLGNNGSVQMGNTTINNGGVTIQPSAGDATKSVSLTNKGLDNGGNKITNVAAGEISDTSTDAVNGSQLNTVKTLAGKHTEVTVEGGTAAGTTDYAGENLKLKVTDDNGQKTYDLKLSDKLSIGGKDGQDGHIGVNGADGKSGVGIDGKDGISIKGKDGNDGVTIKGIDGKDGVNGAEGHIGLNGKDGMTDIWTKPGTPGLNGKDGETMTRIVYKDPNGQEHEAATLDDGLKFGGDFGNASAVKLNKQVNVKGNAKTEADLTDGNIGVVSSQDGENGQLLVKLNKDLDLTDKGSVKMGNTTINNAGVTIQPSVGDATKSVSLTNKGLDNGGNKITNVAAGEISDTSTDAVNGSQLNTVKTLAGKHTEVTVEGGTAAGTTDYAGENLKLKVTDDNGQKTYDLKLSDKLSIGGKDGQDGHIGVNGADGKSGVGIDGKDGISIKGKDGNDGVTIKGIDGKDGVNGAEGHIGLNGKDGMTDIWTKPGTPGLNGKDGETMTRIVYKDPNGQEHEAATLDDGLKFGGDFGNASAVKLNKQVNVKGNAKTEADLTDGNIGVVSSQDGENGQLLVKLNKDLDLTDKGSVKMGNTTINNAGVTIQPSVGDATKSVSLTNKGLDNGGNKITNVAAGEISDTSTDAVNGSQLNTVKTLAGKHTEVTVEGGTAAGTTDYAGENLKLKVTDDNGQKTYDLKLSDKLSIGGKDGQDGHIGVNGADGKSGVGIDGKDGISIKGKDGNDGVTIKGIDGKDGVNGAEGHIGLNGKDGMTDIWTKPGTPGLNGKDGETMTRIVYKDPNGQEHEAATLDDGLKFGGDFLAKPRQSNWTSRSMSKAMPRKKPTSQTATSVSFRARMVTTASC